MCAAPVNRVRRVREKEGARLREEEPQFPHVMEAGGGTAARERELKKEGIEEGEGAPTESPKWRFVGLGPFGRTRPRGRAEKSATRDEELDETD